MGRTVSPDGNGVSGLAESTSGFAIGVYGRSDSPTGWGVYSNCNAHVDGQLTFKPITGTISVPAISFRPRSSDTTYASDISWLENTSATSQYFAAGLQLPNNAVITKVTFYWEDTSGTYNASLDLIRITFSSTLLQVTGSTNSVGASGAGSSTISSILYPTVDNTQYSYALDANLPPSNLVYLNGATVEYTINQPY